MKIPTSFVRVVFLCYPKGCGFTGGQEAPTAALNCVLRSGHSAEEKIDMLKRLWSMFQGLTGFATDQNRDIPSGDSLNQHAMEMGADHASGGREHQCLNSSLGRPNTHRSSGCATLLGCCGRSACGGTPEELKKDLIGMLGADLVRHRISDLVRYASDASPYRYIPKVIVQPKNIDHVAAIFRYCTRKGRHATFRAGGTSLNGQSQGDDILIDVRQHWSGWKVEEDGSRIRCNVGTTLGAHQ